MIKQNGILRQKTKTKTIIDKLDAPNYTRKPLHIFDFGSHIATRALIMGRFGMLLCGANYSSGSNSKMCTNCKVTDTEAHRINDCVLYRNTNRYDLVEKCDFDDIYDDNPERSMNVVKQILKLWDLGNRRNVMMTS